MTRTSGTAIDRDTKLFLFFAASRVAVALAAFAMAAVIGRMLGPQGLGQWALIVAAGALLHTALVNWTHAGTVRFGAEEWIAERRLRRTMSDRLPLVAAGIAAAALLVAYQPFGWLRWLFGVDAADWPLVAVSALALWLAAETQAALQATDNILRQAIVAPIAALLAVAAAVAAWAARGPDLGLVVLASAGSACVAWLVVWFAYVAPTVGRIAAPTRGGLAQHMTYSGPLVIGFAVGYVATWGDHLLLRQFATPGDLGHFSLAYQMFATIVASSGMLATVALPRLIKASTQSDTAVTVYVREAGPTLLVLWASCMVVLVALLPWLLVAAGGPRFEPAVEPFLILCAVIPVSVVTGLYSALFSFQRRHGRALLYSCLMAAVNIVVSLALIPLLGAIGSAIGTVTSYGVSQAAYALDQHRRAGVSWLPVASIWGLLLFAGAIQAGIGRGVWLRLLWAAVTVGVLAALARRTGAVSPRIMNKVFSGPLAPVGARLTRVLIAPVAAGRPSP